jgi:Secretion system C-terminal sorting domain
VNSSAYIIDTIENPGTLSFDVKISMGGYPYWLQEGLVVGIEPASRQMPGEFALYQNYPNPFNVSTKIEFRIPKNEFVTLKIYNLLGEEVATLLSGQLLSGFNSCELDASKLASGMYFYRVSVGSLTGKAGELIQIKKALLLK